MSNITMNAKDSVSAKLANCFITIGENRYNFMQGIKFEAKMDKTKSEIPILGRTAKGNKAGGWKGTWSMTAHYNQSIMRELLEKFKESGEDIYFEIQVSNFDETSTAGRQTIVFIDCNIDGGILAKFDADADYLDEEITGTFEDWKMPEKFNVLNGML